MAEDAAGEDDDPGGWGKPLPAPLCGCCRRQVVVKTMKGLPYRVRGVTRAPTIERLFFPCRCQALLDAAQCFMCGRCPDCCRCAAPAFLEPR